MSVVESMVINLVISSIISWCWLTVNPLTLWLLVSLQYFYWRWVIHMRWLTRPLAHSMALMRDGSLDRWKCISCTSMVEIRPSRKEHQPSLPWMRAKAWYFVPCGKNRCMGIFLYLSCTQRCGQLEVEAYGLIPASYRVHPLIHWRWWSCQDPGMWWDDGYPHWSTCSRGSCSWFLPAI